MRYALRRNGILVWLLAMSFLSPLAVATFAVVYANHIERESNRQWCGTLNAVDYPGQKAEPGPRGEVIRNIRELRHKYGCDQK